MVDPVTSGLGAGAIAAYLGKDGLQKLLGPTADYLGGTLKSFTERRVENIGKIFSNAREKLGEKLEQPGAVPPKVLKQIIDNGSFADDAIEIQYLGGVLASSRSETVRDNRGAGIAKQIDLLSNYQLRAHYLIYGSIKALFAGKGVSTLLHGRQQMKVFLPWRGFALAMDFTEAEARQAQQMLTHIFFGLHRLDLIEGEFIFGPAEQIKGSAPNAKEDGVMCQPSAPGIELFLWAFGKGNEGLDYIFDPTFSPRLPDMPMIVPGAVPATPENS